MWRTPDEWASMIFKWVRNGKMLACVAWRFWLGALSNKGGRGQRNREEIGVEATYFSRGFAARSRALRANFAATPLLRPAQQNRHATQASKMHECQSYHISPLTGENSPSVKNMIKNS